MREEGEVGRQGLIDDYRGMVRAGLVAVAMLAVAAGAFVPPLAGYRDCSPCAPASHRDRLRAAAELMFTIPPLKLQVVEAHVDGPNPEQVSGKVAVRSLFGVQTGTVDVERRGTSNSTSLGKEAALWGGFLLAEAAMAAAALWLLWNAA